MRYRLTGDERHDITQAPAPIENFEFEVLIADTSYDAAEFIESVTARNAEAVIPPRWEPARGARI